jgi:hypothetical protein
MARCAETLRHLTAQPPYTLATNRTFKNLDRHRFYLRAGTEFTVIFLQIEEGRLEASIRVGEQT